MTRFDYEWLADLMAAMLENGQISDKSVAYFRDRLGYKYANFDPVRFTIAMNKNRVKYKR